MNLEQAIQLIRTTRDAMQQRYKRPVFDEMSLVNVVGLRLYLVWYEGPRKESYAQSFRADTAALRAETGDRSPADYHIGEFEFTKEGRGARSEAFMRVGHDIYLICTNTKLSMKEIAQHPLWLKAQEPFAEMGDAFRRSPLLLTELPGAPELIGPVRRPE